MKNTTFGTTQWNENIDATTTKTDIVKNGDLISCDHKPASDLVSNDFGTV